MQSAVERPRPCGARWFTAGAGGRPRGSRTNRATCQPKASRQPGAAAARRHVAPPSLSAYTMSPYPTVVIVTTAHQKASGMDLNKELSEPASAKYTALENRTTPVTQRQSGASARPDTSCRRSQQWSLSPPPTKRPPGWSRSWSRRCSPRQSRRHSRRAQHLVE